MNKARKNIWFNQENVDVDQQTIGDFIPKKWDVL